MLFLGANSKDRKSQLGWWRVYIIGTFLVGATFSLAANHQVNAKAISSVTQSNTKVLGEAPAEAMGNVYQSKEHNLSEQQQTLPLKHREEHENDTVGVSDIYAAVERN